MHMLLWMILQVKDVQKYFDYLLEELRLIGLHINTSKSETFGIYQTCDIFNMISKFDMVNNRPASPPPERTRADAGPSHPPRA